MVMMFRAGSTVVRYWGGVLVWLYIGVSVVKFLGS